MTHTIHELKIWSKYFQVVRLKIKTFELRKNDRNYKKGDVLLLREWDPEGEYYTGRVLTKRVIYFFETEMNGMGLEPGYCIMGLGESDE